MIAPTTPAGAAIFSAAKMKGSAVGTRSLPQHLPVARRVGAHELERSGLDRGQSRIVLIVTGKNVSRRR